MFQLILTLFICVVWSTISYANINNNKFPTGMVVSEQHLASAAGAAILRQGGNAVDAAIAVGYVLAVVNPCCGNIGGGGFMTLHLANGKNIFFNFRERAPFAAHQRLFLNRLGNIDPKKSTEDYLAVAVPGTVLGFEAILKQYGTFSRQQIMAPAIQLAEKGFILQVGDIHLLKPETSTFAKQSNVAAIFLKNGKPYQVGDRLVQADLAQTLKLIAEKGSSAFYRGKIAQTIVTASTEHGGVLTLKDFKQYYVEKLKPVQCTYRGYTIVTAPPPSSGGVTLCEILNILEGYPLKSYGHLTAKSIYYIVHAMGLGFQDRNTQLGDPNFVSNPVSHLLSKQYADYLRLTIPAFGSLPQSMSINTEMHEGINTTHYSVIDKMGNAVSVTYTLNSFFGAKVIAGHTGFFLNNEMDDFAIGKTNQFGLQQGIKNRIEPGKRPLSSMTPTVILQRDNKHKYKVFMIVGSPGGPRIITTTLLTILNVIDYGMDLQSAVNAARLHYQGIPDIIYIEPNALNGKVIKSLTTYLLRVQEHMPWGAVEAIYVDPITRQIIGANDKRRPAGAVASVY